MTDADDRVRCVDCRHFVQRRWQCVNARAAMLERRIGVTATDVGPELSEKPQH